METQNARNYPKWMDLLDTSFWQVLKQPNFSLNRNELFLVDNLSRFYAKMLIDLAQKSYFI